MPNSLTIVLSIEDVPSGAVLKSIQQVKLDLAAGAGAQDFTINSVDITKSFLIPGGTHFPHDESEYGAYTLRLKNATAIEYNRELAIGNADAYACVVEFKSGIKSIVRAVTALPAGTNHVPVDITTVDLSKAFISYLGCRSANGLGRNQVGVVWFKYAYRIYVQNPSKTAGDQWISWEMVEFE